MGNDLLIHTAVRVCIKDGEETLSVGSGTLLKTTSGFHVLTAYHCIFGEEDQFSEYTVDQIYIETQVAYNAPFSRHDVIEIVDFDKDQDWVLLEINYLSRNGDFPEVLNSKNFKLETPLQFKGFQEVDADQSRTFNAKILDETSNDEFRITLDKGDNFKAGVDSAMGLSGSGAYITIDNKLYLIGIIKSVKGEEANNNDIKCCPLSCITKFLEEGLHDLSTDAVFDEWARRKFEEISLSDPRNLIEKLQAVNPAISTIRIKKYCRDLALGKEEISHVLERDMSAIKFRIFEACQNDLIEFVETNGDRELLPNEINDLLDVFTKKAVSIIEIKSKKYRYPILDEDLLRKVILDLINECYLSFDLEGIYNG